MRSPIAKQQALTYVCTFCKHMQNVGRLSPMLQPPCRSVSLYSKAGLLSRSLRAPGRTRVLHTTQCRSATNQTSTTVPVQGAPLEYSFSIVPKVPKPSRTSQIRKSLQQWSTQNTRAKEAAAPDTLTFEGKIKQLPNALFVGTKQELVEEEQDELDEQNQRFLDDSIDEESVEPQGALMQPGSLRVVSSKLIPKQNGVYLGDIGTQSLFLLSNGKWAAFRSLSKRSSVTTSFGVVVPNFLTVDEVEYLRSYMPKRDVERAVNEDAVASAIEVSGSLPDEVLRTILPKLKQAGDEEVRFWRQHRTKLQQMYNTFAHEETWQTVSMYDLPRLVLGMDYDAMTWLERKAFIRYANNIHPLFIATQTATSITYYVAPKRLEKDVVSVEKWARTYQEAAAQAAMGKNVSELLRTNPLSSFIDKARRMITKSRKIRAPTSLGILGPVNRQVGSHIKAKISSDEILTDNDKSIINYLGDLVLRRPISRNTMAHAALIVRAVGAYPTMELSLNAFRMLLQEIGCADPWTTFEDISVPLPGRRASTVIDQLDYEARESIKGFTDIQNESTTLVDTMQNLRKDWGETIAFCIDQPTAQNREDAISVEPATELEGGYWLHTHFAHPTAHLEPDHPVAKFARKRGSAYYGPFEGGRIQTMIPFSVIKQFSIKRGSPVLTVSTLMSMDGQVHDVKVVPGILRNVQFIDVAALNEVMGNVAPEQAILIVGDVSAFQRRLASAEKLGPKPDTEGVLKYMPQFHLLSQLLTARRNQRAKEVGTPARLCHVSSTMSTYIRLPDVYTPYREAESYHWDCDPDIMILGNRGTEILQDAEEIRAWDMTAQAMRLAAESLGKWLGDRNIPAVYLGSSPPPGHSIEEMNEKGPHEETAKMVFTRTSHPEPLLNRNMKQYTPCTSPMRKFYDMLNHFQVDSYLKAQAQGQIEIDQPVHDDSVMALPRTAIDEYLAKDAAAGDHIDDLNRSTKSFWAFQAIFRAFHFKEAYLPEIMEVYITSPTRREASGLLEPAAARLVPWSLPVSLEPSPEGYENTAKVREFIPVKLMSVDPNRGTIFARAVGPPTVDQQILDPIRCYNPQHTFDEKTRKNTKP